MKISLGPVLLAIALSCSIITSASSHHRVAHNHFDIGDAQHGIETQEPLSEDPDPVSASTREHWMRRARLALFELTGSPCPPQAFGAVIVNHTGRADDDVGELICIGANKVLQSGNPTLHGEIAAINNCTDILSSAPYSLNGSQILAAWKTLSLYTTAEACSMCASAINWANFREYIYATTIWGLIDMGYKQIPLSSREIFQRSPTGHRTRIVGSVLENEMNELFRWQFQDGECPTGCARSEKSGKCRAKK